MNIPVSEFDKSTNGLALEIFTKGYDTRFQRGTNYTEYLLMRNVSEQFI